MSDHTFSTENACQNDSTDAICLQILDCSFLGGRYPALLAHPAWARISTSYWWECQNLEEKLCQFKYPRTIQPKDIVKNLNP